MCTHFFVLFFFFFFNDTATTEIYTLSLHDALPIRHPWGHGGRSALVLCFRYSSPENPRGFPSSSIHPCPGMPCSPTPAGSPAQSPWPTLTVAFPFADTVGPCFSLFRGSIASLSLRPVGRSAYASSCSLPRTTQS